MPQSPRRSSAVPVTMPLLVVALVGGVLVVAAVVGWASDVVPLGAVIGVVLVTGLVELGVAWLLQRRASRQHARAHEPIAGSSASTLDADGSGMRHGYDPMEGHRGSHDR